MESFEKVCRLRTVKIVALFHLFVLNAAADCKKPQATETFVLGKAALLSNEFPDGFQVTLECGHGYKKVSGSGTTVCSNGQWSEPDLICEEKDCGLPKAEPHMTFNTSQGTRFRAVMRVFCDKGYKLSGTSYKRCYATGWVGNAKCQIVTCDKPGQVTNGRSLWSSGDPPKYGEAVQYLCNQGYTLVGKEKVVCTETGRYDSQPPQCQDAGPTIVTSTSPPPNTSTVSSAATRAAAGVSSTGGLHIPNTEARGVAATITPTTSLEDKWDVETGKHTGYVAIIFGIVCILLVVFTIGLCACKFLLRRKGSYDTREDPKPELSHFHSL